MRLWLLFLLGLLAMALAEPLTDESASEEDDDWSDSEDNLSDEGSDFDEVDDLDASSLSDSGIEDADGDYAESFADQELDKMLAQYTKQKGTTGKKDIALEEKILNNLSNLPDGACWCHKPGCTCNPEIPLCWNERKPKTCLKHTEDKECVKRKKEKYCVAKDKKRICTKYKGGCDKWKTDKICLKYKDKTTTSKKCGEWAKKRKCEKWESKKECLEWKTDRTPGTRKCIKWKKDCKTTETCEDGAKKKVCTDPEEKKTCEEWSKPYTIPGKPKKCEKYEDKTTCEKYETKKTCKKWGTETIPGACTTTEPKKECKEYEDKKTCTKQCEGNCKMVDEWGLIWAEPHLETLDGHDYNFVWMGDYWLLKPTGDVPLKAQVRSTPAHRNGERLHGTVLTALAARMGEDTVEVYAKDLTFLLNGKPFDPREPRKLADGSRLVKNGKHELSIVSGHVALMVKVVTTERGKGDENILDVNVRVGKKDMGQFVGILGNVNEKEGDYKPEDHMDELRLAPSGEGNLFTREYTPPSDWTIWTDDDVAKMSPDWKQWAKDSCKKASLKGRRLDACMYDLLVTKSRQFIDVEKSAAKQLTHDMDQYGGPGIKAEAKKLAAKAREASKRMAGEEGPTPTKEPQPQPTAEPEPEPEPTGEPAAPGGEEDMSDSDTDTEESDTEDEAVEDIDPSVWPIASSVADVDGDNQFQQANYKPRFAVSEANDAPLADLLEDWEQDDSEAEAESEAEEDEDAAYQYCQVPEGAKSEADRPMKKTKGVCVTTTGSGRHICIGDLMPKKSTYKCGSRSNRKCCVSNDETRALSEHKAKVEKAENGQDVTMTSLWCGRNVKCPKSKCSLDPASRSHLCRVGPLRLIGGKWYSMRWRKTKVKKCGKVCCKEKTEKICKEYRDVAGEKKCQPDVEKKKCDEWKDEPTEKCEKEKKEKKCSKWSQPTEDVEVGKKCKSYKTEKTCKKWEEQCTKKKTETKCKKTDECEEWKEEPGTSKRKCVKWGPKRTCKKWKDHRRCIKWVTTPVPGPRVCVDWKTKKTCTKPAKECEKWKTVVTCTKERLEDKCIEWKTKRRCAKWSSGTKRKCITLK